jgi:hypothetical protein
MGVRERDGGVGEEEGGGGGGEEEQDFHNVSTRRR